MQRHSPVAKMGEASVSSSFGSLLLSDKLSRTIESVTVIRAIIAWLASVGGGHDRRLTTVGLTHQTNAVKLSV